MFDWPVIFLAAAFLLLATWCASEWACRRIAARYASRRRLWTGLGPDDGGPEPGAAD